MQSGRDDECGKLGMGKKFASLWEVVSEKTLNAVTDMGFTDMMEIQHKSIRSLLDGKYVYTVPPKCNVARARLCVTKNIAKKCVWHLFQSQFFFPWLKLWRLVIEMGAMPTFYIARFFVIRNCTHASECNVALGWYHMYCECDVMNAYMCKSLSIQRLWRMLHTHAHHRQTDRHTHTHTHP